MGNDKQRQKRQQKKQQRRAHRLEKAATAPKPVIVGKSPTLPKLSAAIGAFAQPLVDMLGDDPGEALYQKALYLAAIVWNLEILASKGVEEDLRKEFDVVMAEMAGTARIEKERLDDVCQMLARRKRTLFPHDDRVIADLQVQDVGDGYHIVAMGYGSGPPPA